MGCFELSQSIANIAPGLIYLIRKVQELLKSTERLGFYGMGVLDICTLRDMYGFGENTF